MSFDLTKLASQLQPLASKLRGSMAERERRLDVAEATLRDASCGQDVLARKLRDSDGTCTFLLPRLREPLDTAHDPPVAPEDYVALAVDGSHIDVDRHSPARCYVINTGRVMLRYGASPGARLDSEPRVYLDEDDLFFADPDGTREVPVEGALLGLKRAVLEAQALASLVAETPPDLPAIALLDGSLVLWGLAGQNVPDFVRRELLDAGLLPALDALRQVSKQRPLAVASYISLPRGSDVMGAVRLQRCPYEVADCDRHCGTLRPGKRPCDEAAYGLTDRDLFARLLRPGQRSAVFGSTSSIVQKHYGEHQVCFFYLHAGQELARVELPQWVADDESMMGLAHTLTLDQSRRGMGYPVSLQEAHEQAVLSGADRQQFWSLVQASLDEEALPSATSAKAFSKRVRWL